MVLVCLTIWRPIPDCQVRNNATNSSRHKVSDLVILGQQEQALFVIFSAGHRTMNFVRLHL